MRGAQRLGVTLLIGSLGIKTGDADGRFANRSFLIGPDGEIKRVTIKSYVRCHRLRKPKATASAAYRPGDAAITAMVTTAADEATIGMAVCYDLRFPHLFRALAHAGAQILTLPAAFNDTTGAAH